MRNESWLDIRILKTPEVEQPRKPDCIQDNPQEVESPRESGIAFGYGV